MRIEDEMPTEMEIAKFIIFVLRAMKDKGEDAHIKLLAAEPLLAVMADVRIRAVMAGPQEHRDIFLSGLEKMVF